MLTGKATIQAVLRSTLNRHLPMSLAPTLSTDSFRTPEHAVVLVSASPGAQPLLSKMFPGFTRLTPSGKDYLQIANDSRKVEGLSRGCLVDNFLTSPEEAL
jgi:hypothetical protein